MATANDAAQVTLPEIPPSVRPARRAAVPTPPRAGTPIAGTYRVLDTLGDGGMGVVLLARDEALDRHVAIKLVRGQMARHQQFRDRFRAEARAMARVKHANVVTIHASSTL